MKIWSAFLFIFFILTDIYAQSYEKGLFFSDDLSVLAQQSEVNLEAFLQDEVRAEVARFKESKDVFGVANQRDTAITVAFWFKPKNIDIHPGTLIGEDSVFYFRYLPNRGIQFNHYLKQDLNTAGVLTNDEWQHLGFSLQKDGRLAIYLNGESILNDQISPLWWQKKGKIVVGKDRYNVDAEGCIDDLKIWNRALSPAEMKKVFRETRLIPDLSYKLESYMPLKGDFSDLAKNPKKLVESSHVKFVTDSLKGLVADFQNKDSRIETSGFSFDNQLTIAVWAKPTDKDWVMALAGNRDFSMRYIINQGRLWFNIPMVYSCQADKRIGYPQEWVHLAIAVNYNHKIEFFINGQLVDSKSISGKAGREESLMIGQSIWKNTFNGQLSQFAIWDRALSEFEIKEVYNGKLDVALRSSSQNSYSTYIAVIAIVLLFVIFFLWKLTQNRLKKLRDEPQNEDAGHNIPQKNAFCFFETFQAFDRKGTNISHDFTPTLIRLFALILLYPRIYNRKISSQELSDILWENDDVAQKKNNRGTNVHRLRTLFKQFDGLSLVYSNKEWEIDIPDHVFVDLFYLKDNLPVKGFDFPFKSMHLCKPLKNECFDSIVRLINDQYIDLLKSYCCIAFSQKEWKPLEKFASLWISIDPLTEEALSYLVTALVNSQQKQKALNTYNRFATNYKSMLNEDFKLSFELCILPNS
ncbi:LamG domain-containing protein [Labilibaculum antarcticum]|uniref:LamG-like jellyroll fold domain-containing protein n=1 Tax=Labilibaculum antarcticum TaxID=1717717 RepID=A0A1Y1CPG0_9BACT|nr:LamG-like jellyroll fold domain-containing protein [Labilibaculum antarcticum]BAX81131.1 hypothetical protein ALGA_2824 [Labilibaculum antarcticum]